MPDPKPTALLAAAGAFRPVSRLTGAFARAAAVCSALLVLSGPGYAAKDGFGARLSIKSAAPAPDGAFDLCSRYRWACAMGRRARSGSPPIQMVRGVNRSVNARVRQVEDINQYHREEYWTLPSARGGDCEDIALLKKQELIGRGVSPGRLLLATVLDRQQKNHAVLVFRTDQGDYVLDNLSNRMLLWWKTGYYFLRMQDPDAPSHWVAVMAGGNFRG